MPKMDGILAIIFFKRSSNFSVDIFHNFGFKCKSTLFSKSVSDFWLQNQKEPSWSWGQAYSANLSLLSEVTLILFCLKIGFFDNKWWNRIPTKSTSLSNSLQKMAVVYYDFWRFSYNAMGKGCAKIISKDLLYSEIYILGIQITQTNQAHNIFTIFWAIPYNNWFECNLPQWEWRTARVQKATSVPKLVQTNGTIKAGICARETNLSAVHNLTWSPLLWTAVVAKNCDGIKVLLVFGIFEIKVWFLLKFFKPQRIACCLNNDEANILEIS